MPHVEMGFSLIHTRASWGDELELLHIGAQMCGFRVR